MPADILAWPAAISSSSVTFGASVFTLTTPSLYETPLDASDLEALLPADGILREARTAATIG